MRYPPHGCISCASSVTSLSSRWRDQSIGRFFIHHVLFTQVSHIHEEFSRYLIFADEIKIPNPVIYVVLEISWRLRIGDAEPSSNFSLKFYSGFVIMDPESNNLRPGEALLHELVKWSKTPSRFIDRQRINVRVSRKVYCVHNWCDNELAIALQTTFLNANFKITRTNHKTIYQRI